MNAKRVGSVVRGVAGTIVGAFEGAADRLIHGIMSVVANEFFLMGLAIVAMVAFLRS
jgi:hypothetical protein